MGTRKHPRLNEPWTEKELALLGTLSDAKVAQKVGRTLKACEMARVRHRIAPYKPVRRAWTKAELKLLGTMSDAALAIKLGCRRLHVIKTRQRLGVAAFSPKNRPRKMGGP